MPDIFINFRKPDRSLERDRLYRALTAVYGPDAVFKSGVSIPPGADYPEVLAAQARACKIMLVLIGPDWLSPDEYGYSPSYWDQLEITTALVAGNTVIPVLLGDAVRLPSPDELPPQIARLGRLQFQRLAEVSFDQDVAGFVDRLSKALPPSAMTPVPLPGPSAPPAPPQSPIAVSGRDTNQLTGQAGRDMIAVQHKRIKLFGAEVPLTALIVGVLGFGGAATGVGVSVASSDSAPSAVAAPQSDSATLAIGKCMEVDANLDIRLVRNETDSAFEMNGNRDIEPNGVCYVMLTPEDNQGRPLPVMAALMPGDYVKTDLPAPDGTCTGYTSMPHYYFDLDTTTCVDFGQTRAKLTWVQSKDQKTATVTLTRA